MTLAITAAVRTGSPMQVRLLVSSTTSAPNPVPLNTVVDVRRVHADGSIHRVLTEASPRVVGGAWVWLDAHAPYNQAVRYTVTAAGATATSASVTLPSRQSWLISSIDNDLAVRCESINRIGERTSPSRAAKFSPESGKSVFLSAGSRAGITGSLVFRVTDEAPLWRLFATDAPVLINTPGTKGWDVKWLWVQPLDVTYDNPADLVKYPYRHVTMPFEECEDPDNDFEFWTSADALAYWSARGKVSGDGPTLYASSLDAVTDTRR